MCQIVASQVSAETSYLKFHNMTEPMFAQYEQRRKLAQNMASAVKPKKKKEKEDAGAPEADA